MKTVCPHCNQEYDVPDEYVNQTVNCTVCNKNFVAHAVLQLQPKAPVDVKKTSPEKQLQTIFIVKVCIAVVVVAAILGGWFGWKSYQDGKVLSKLQEVLADAQKKQLGAGLESHDRQEAFKLRRQNAENFTQRLNTILKAAKYPTLSEKFQLNFAGLTAYGKTDTWDLLAKLGIRDKLAKASSVAKFCRELETADIPLLDKEKLLEEYYGGNWRLQVIADNRKINQEKHEELWEKYSYLSERIEETKINAFNENKHQFAFSDFDTFMERGSNKDKEVFTQILNSRVIFCHGFGLNRNFSYSEVVTMAEETINACVDLLFFVPRNVEFLRDVHLFPAEGENPLFTTVDNCLIDSRTRVLIYAIKHDAEKYTIPAGTTIIGEQAFIDCGNMTAVTIPDSVTGIGNYAFARCTSLAEVNIPGSVSEIGNCAFAECLKLAKVDILNGVKKIGAGAFSDCQALTSVIIPDSVTEIGNYAFAGCLELTKINIPDSVTGIGENAFFHCRKLTRIDIPNRVKKIESRTFYGCWNLAEVNIPDSVIEIDSYAFGDCSKLISVKMSRNIQRISRNAFNGSACERVVASLFRRAIK